MAEASKKRIVLRTYEDYHQSYVELADHPHELRHCVFNTVRIHHLIDDYDGPEIQIDFDENGRAVGIEILYSYADEEGNIDEKGEDVDAKS
ncbi:MAG: DUF2283 domain-containing protein [Planctomycetales bacterium]